ncbi:unnamed protein product [Caenorhabditis angaria]|uniref:Uncharacterized protein n=1 Tax=Caenorhabditis angaria TaxID=860376 RepID=A0A9P1IKX9_9PELO|nr:unnamed protein product [Caenorhabditis angaria]
MFEITRHFWDIESSILAGAHFIISATCYYFYRNAFDFHKEYLYSKMSVDFTRESVNRDVKIFGDLCFMAAVISFTMSWLSVIYTFFPRKFFSAQIFMLAVYQRGYLYNIWGVLQFQYENAKQAHLLKKYAHYKLDFLWKSGNLIYFLIFAQILSAISIIAFLICSGLHTRDQWRRRRFEGIREEARRKYEEVQKKLDKIKGSRNRS